ncbi:MAG: CvpA family protein [Bacteroides sp.]|nr:CvpA family protein [Bacteroides sp.]MBD5319035.1 CvpA family protein [Bacteroides sp.]MBD5354883.1 CvpA family protein [Bacteroides sp.]
MAAIDIILILIFILTAWLGFRKGLIVQLGSVAAIVVAIIACRMFGATVENLFFDCHPDWQTGSSLSRYGVSILANGVIYLVAYYAVILVAKFLHTATHAILLAPLDHIAGALFSVAKYGLLVSLLLNLYIVLFPSAKFLADSRLAGGKVVELTVGFAPWVLDAIHPSDKGADDCPEGEPIPVATESAAEV